MDTIVVQENFKFKHCQAMLMILIKLKVSMVIVVKFASVADGIQKV